MIQAFILAMATAAVLVVGGLKSARRILRSVKQDKDFLHGLLPGGVATASGDTVATTIAGRLADGTPVGLELVTDTLRLRQLPQQLLVVRFPVRLPATPAIEVARHNSGISLYGNEFRDHVVVSGDAIGLQANLIVRHSGPCDVLPSEISSAVRDMFGDPRVQRLSVGRHGIRLIYEVGVARADAYRITRRVEIHRAAQVDATAQEAIDQAGRVVAALHRHILGQSHQA